MAREQGDYASEEWIQAQFEKQIREQCELHGWATAVSVANPLDILIMLEDEDEYGEYAPQTNIISIERAIS